ncbi:hypothetical protein [Flavobacterium sp.]
MYKVYFENQCPSPDRSGNPFCGFVLRHAQYDKTTKRLERIARIAPKKIF